MEKFNEKFSKEEPKCHVPDQILYFNMNYKNSSPSAVDEMEMKKRLREQKKLAKLNKRRQSPIPEESSTNVNGISAKIIDKKPSDSYIELLKLPVRKNSDRLTGNYVESQFPSISRFSNPDKSNDEHEDDKFRRSKSCFLSSYSLCTSASVLHRSSSASKIDGQSISEADRLTKFKIEEQSLKDMGYDSKYIPNWDKKKQLQKTDLYTILRIMVEKNIRPNVVVCTETMSFNCHLMVLQCYSHFFRDISNENLICLPENKVTPRAFKAIYEWMTTDNAKTDREYILEIYTAATFLGVDELICQCWHLIGDDELFVEDAAFLFYIEANTHGIHEVKELLLPRIHKFFLTAVASLDFLCLDIDDVIKLLSSNSIGVNSEMEVFFSAVRWLHYDWPNRNFYCEQVMRCVRFNLMPAWFLVTLQKQKMEVEISNVIGNAVVKQLIDEGLMYATSFLQFGGKDEDLEMFLKDLNLERPVQRSWIFDSKCVYHHDINCQTGGYLKYELFLAYLSQLKNKRDWTNLKTTSSDINKCCNIAVPSAKAMKEPNRPNSRSLNYSSWCVSKTGEMLPFNIHDTLKPDEIENELSSGDLEEPSGTVVVTMLDCKRECPNAKINCEKNHEEDISNEGDDEKDIAKKKNTEICSGNQRVEAGKERQLPNEQLIRKLIKDFSKDKVEVHSVEKDKSQHIGSPRNLESHKELTLEKSKDKAPSTDESEDASEDSRNEVVSNRSSESSVELNKIKISLDKKNLKASSSDASDTSSEDINLIDFDAQELDLKNIKGIDYYSTVALKEIPNTVQCSSVDKKKITLERITIHQREDGGEQSIFNLEKINEEKRQLFLEKRKEELRQERSFFKKKVTGISLEVEEVEVEDTSTEDERESSEALTDTQESENIPATDEVETPFLSSQEIEAVHLPSFENVECFKKLPRKLIVFSGPDPLIEKNQSKNCGDTVLYYDNGSRIWKCLTHMPLPSRRNFTAIECLGIIYVLGGTTWKNNEEILENKVYSLDAKSLEWKFETEMPEPRKDFAVVHLLRTSPVCQKNPPEHGIFVIGGQDIQGNILATVWYFDIKRKIWTEKSKLNTPRFGLSAILINNEIVVAGGVIQRRTVCCNDSPDNPHNHTHLVITNSVEIYRLSFEPYRGCESTSMFNYTGEECNRARFSKWTTCNIRLRLPRLYGKFCLASNGNLYLGGGICKQVEDSIKPLGTIDCYDFRTKQWYQVCKMDCNRHGHDMVEYMNALVIIGGVTGVFGTECCPLRDIFLYKIHKEAKEKTITSLPWPISEAIAIVVR